MTVIVCTKRRFRDRIAATMALANISRQPRQGKNPERCYRCPNCKGWHLTSQPQQIGGPA